MGNKYKTLFLILGGLVLPAFAFAILDPNATSNIYEMIQRIYKFLMMLGVPACVIVILWGAFTMVTSGGDPTKTGNAQKILTWAIVGLIVILLSNAFVSVLGSVLGVKIPKPDSKGLIYLYQHGIKDAEGFYKMAGGKYNPETNEFIDDSGNIYNDVNLFSDGSVEVCRK
jgi:hypothetical protein